MSREAGEPWQDRLLRLPAFLGASRGRRPIRRTTLADGFALTGFFLTRHAFEPRGLALPDAREQLRRPRDPANVLSRRRRRGMSS